MRRSLSGALSTVLALASTAGPALGFCRLRTCNVADPQAGCKKDTDGCLTTGKLLSWPSDCVGFAVQRSGSELQGIDADALGEAFERAFARWTAASCDGAGPSITLESQGSIRCDSSEFNPEGWNANAIIFRDDDWPYTGAIDVYALTRVRFDVSTGAIVDADIELNSAEYGISADGSGSGVDLESILTHEVGHFLGLDHTAPAHADATMRIGWDGTGTELRSLDADDSAGVCAIYPPGRTTAGRSCEPYNGFSGDCLSEQDPIEEPKPPAPPRLEDGGCTLGGAPARGQGLAFIAVLVAAALRRKRFLGR